MGAHCYTVYSRIVGHCYLTYINFGWTFGSSARRQLLVVLIAILRLCCCVRREAKVSLRTFAVRPLWGSTREEALPPRVSPTS